MAQLFKNNAFSSLAASLTNAATTLTVTTGHGDRFPAVSGSDFFMLTLQDAANNVEIVKVTARTAGADSMTIARAQEGFTARAWNIGDVVELRVTSLALNPLSVFAGASTAQTMRDAMAVPSRTGGDASGTWSISITGNAATATAPASGGSFITSSNIGSQSVSYAGSSGNAATATALQTTRSFTIGAAVRNFNGSGNVSWTLAEIGAFPAGGGSIPGSLALGGSAAPVTTLDVQTTGANVLTSVLTTGLSDLNFRLGSMNGVAGSSGTSQGKFGLFYLGTGEVATIDFRRGATATDGSIAFRTSGIDRATLDNSGNLTITGEFRGTGTIPAGAVIHVASSTAPTGYLKANGALVSRTTYAALFAAIGTTFGAGDGWSTFKLPDLRGEFIRGWDDGRAVDTGRVFGSAQDDDFKSHFHTISAQQDGTGAGPYPDATSLYIGASYNTNATGGTETRPRNIALLACIRF